MKSRPIVIGIISSARENSNSAIMVREALKGAAGKGAVAREIYLPEYDLEYCTGCLSCMKNGKCRLPDGFNELREQLYEADGIIWGTPTYAGTMNAIMKNLIDRLGMYEVSTSSLGGKYMAGIAAASSPGTAKRVAKSLSRFWYRRYFYEKLLCGLSRAGFKGGRSAENDKAC
jgi:multimeric flavodoxin WrbA